MDTAQKDNEIEIRNYVIDLLKVIGLMCVILCHVEPPPLVYNIRNFDVTMLVFASAMGFAASGKNYLDSKGSYFFYIKKRIKRLAIPTWSFLVVYFLFFNIINFVKGGQEINFTKADYFLSFTFISGIGYVWIIRVFLLMAVIAPFILAFAKRINGARKEVFLFMVIIIINEYFVKWLNMDESIAKKLVEFTFGYIISYGLVYYVGIRANCLKKGELWVLTSVFAIVFYILMILFKFPMINEMKYPPRLLYISYGIMVSLFILVIYNYMQKKFRGGVIQNCIIYISKNTLTIYFIHIFLVRSLEYGLINLGKFDNWIVRYIFTIGISVIITFIYTFLKRKCMVRDTK